MGTLRQAFCPKMWEVTSICEHPLLHLAWLSLGLVFPTMGKSPCTLFRVGWVGILEPCSKAPYLSAPAPPLQPLSQPPG